MAEDKGVVEARFGVWSAVLGGLIAATATIVTGYFGFWKDNREIELKMVDFALAILAGEKGGKAESQPKEARRFAVRALQQQSRVNMADEHWESWIDNNARLNIDRLPGFSPSQARLDISAPLKDESATFGLVVAGNDTDCDVTLEQPPGPTVTLNGACSTTPFRDAVGWTVLRSYEPSLPPVFQLYMLYKTRTPPTILMQDGGDWVGESHDSKTIRLRHVGTSSMLLEPSAREPN